MIVLYLTLDFIFLLDNVKSGIITCERVYDYGSDEELKVDLLESGRRLEGPEVSSQ